VIVIDPEAPPTDPKDPEDCQCARALEMWLQNGGCHRAVISETMDGERVICDDIPTAQRCDNCTPNDFISSAWTVAIKKASLIASNNTLTPFHPIQDECITETKPPDFHIRPPNAAVIQHSAAMVAAHDALLENTTNTFKRVVNAGPTCSICWFLNATQKGGRKPIAKHKGLRACSDNQGGRGIKGFQRYYDYNTPNKSSSTVSGCDTFPAWCWTESFVQWSYDNRVFDNWCFFCGFPTRLHTNQEIGPQKCPAVEFTLGLAWVILQNPSPVRDRLQDQLDCGQTVWENPNAWYAWLCELDEGAQMYNLHRLAGWFLDTYQ
jgi:hypothetical protein